MLLHSGIKASLINRKVFGSEGVLSEIKWKAVGVIKLKGNTAIKNFLIPKVRNLFIKQADPTVERLTEPPFFQK